MLLYLTHQGSRLRREAECLVVEQQGRRVARAPAFQVERVVVFGHSELTSGAVDLLLSRGIDCAFVSLAGRLKGRLVSGESRNVALRLAQFARHGEPEFCLGVSREIVAAKLRNQRALLRRFDRSHREVTLETECEALTKAVEATDSAADLNALRGVEGAGARAYFAALRKATAPEVSFERRQRRPPKDPFNALLSLGYTLLTNEAVAAAAARGFDAAVGFFHVVRPGRPALALDLVEEFRAPMVDRLVLRMVNLKMIGAEEFEPDQDGGLRLKPEPFRRFLTEYETLIAKPSKDRLTGRSLSLRQHLLAQADSLARAVLGKTEHPYAGYLWMR
jgi:CRISPR-associated protein Cas1